MKIKKLSHPLWVRGLKFVQLQKLRLKLGVAPFMGAWIEIFLIGFIKTTSQVAPFMGAWIEIISTGKSPA